MISRRALTLSLPVSALTLSAFGASGPADHTQLEELMEDLDEGVDKIYTAIDDGEGLDAALVETCRLQGVCIAAKDQAPKALEEVTDEAARKSKLRAYRVQMHQLVAGLFALELALYDGDTAAAGEAVAKLDDLKRAGHDQFRPRKK